jgi:hypothetical protein
MSILLSLVLLVIFVLSIVLTLRKITSKSQSPTSTAQPVRLFFQYGLSFGLFIIVTVGVAGLLSRALDTSSIVTADQSSLASSLSFVIVGGPLLVGIIIWLKKSIAANPADGHGFIPTFFATLASVISLLVFLASGVAALRNLVNSDPISGSTLARAIIWGIALVVVLKLANTVIPKSDFRIQYFIGSLITGVAAVIGLVKILTGLFVLVLAQPGLLGTSSPALVDTQNNALHGFAILVLSAALWFYYWVKNANTKTNDTLWLSYVLIAGVGGSLVLALTSLIVSIYRVLVWFVGDPSSDVLSIYFARLPGSIAAAIVGALAWWYHKSLLPDKTQRTEIQRSYEYLVSAISLIASTIGLSIVLVAIIESFSKVLIAGDSAINTLIGAITVMLVSGPVWWKFWNQIQDSAAQSPEKEVSSPVRRIYLLLLFGVGGVTSIISLITIVFLIFDALLGAGLGIATLNEMRFALGMLISTGIVAAYHWAIYRQDKQVDVASALIVKSILLVGPKDDEFVRSLKDATGARVTSWISADTDLLSWPIEQVIAQVKQSENSQILVLLESTGVRVIPVDY